MATKKKPSAEAMTIQEVVPTTGRKNVGASGKNANREAAAGEGCDCRASTAFHKSIPFNMPPGFNSGTKLSVAGIPAAGKRAVIELVTATITVPAGEKARLRLCTSLGPFASNLDLVLIPQGIVAGQDVLVATHSLRVYTDNLIQFYVNRDNPQTPGTGFVCISGYLVDV